MKGLFITATNTDIGKTMITGAIAAALQSRGIRVGVFKPLASGAARGEDGKLTAEDASFLMKAAGISESLRNEVNAICLEPAFTPAIAAKESGIKFDMEQVIGDLLANAEKYEISLVEGVGGITAPLWEDYLVKDLMKRLNLPSVMVSHSKLGSINDTVLTQSYAQQHEINIGGVIFNCWDYAAEGILEQSNQLYIEKITGLAVLGKMPLLADGVFSDLRQAELANLAEKYLSMNQILRLIG